VRRDRGVWHGFWVSFRASVARVRRLRLTERTSRRRTKSFDNTGSILMKFTALRFTATAASPAAKRTRILSVTQHADNIWNEGKCLPLFTDHRRCWKWCPSTRRHSSHRWKRFRFTFWRFSAAIFEISLRMFSFSSSVRGLWLSPM
jgi:hypothetical protein